ncbi:hypothetical protein F4806DRAFT_252309 [Annulohypoxylon nitens]|nr:hypothetical protein F4806DRAFT_252309 [Annulohypoxylon nitens]
MRVSASIFRKPHVYRGSAWAAWADGYWSIATWVVLFIFSLVAFLAPPPSLTSLIARVLWSYMVQHGPKSKTTAKTAKAVGIWADYACPCHVPSSSPPRRRAFPFLLRESSLGKKRTIRSLSFYLVPLPACALILPAPHLQTLSFTLPVPGLPICVKYSSLIL